MSTIFSSSTNLSLFQVDGDIVLPNKEGMFLWLKDLLAKYSFKDISGCNTETSCGWVQVDDHSAVAFSNPAYMWIDRYIFLRLRKDTRKVPSAVLNQEVKNRNEAWLDDHPGMKRPPKTVREEIKDAVKLELLSKTLPVPKLVDAVWDTSSSEVMLLTAANAEIDLFCDMFAKTFEGGRLVARVPYALAHENAIDDAMRTELDKNDQAVSDSLLDIIESNKWLGYGFATWLLMNSGSLNVNGVSCTVDGKLALLGCDQKAVFTGSIDESLASVRQSLSDGKNISDVRVEIANEEGAVWRAALDTVSFRLKGIKSPVLSLSDAYNETEDHMQADMLMRVWSLESVVKHLFGGFLPAYLKDKFSGMFAAEYAEWFE